MSTTDRDIAQLEASLKQFDSGESNGTLEHAECLEKFAELLRVNKLRLLDAANFSARANAIKSSHGIPTPTTTTDNADVSEALGKVESIESLREGGFFWNASDSKAALGMSLVLFLASFIVMAELSILGLPSSLSSLALALLQLGALFNGFKAHTRGYTGAASAIIGASFFLLSVFLYQNFSHLPADLSSGLRPGEILIFLLHLPAPFLMAADLQAAGFAGRPIFMSLGFLCPPLAASIYSTLLKSKNASATAAVHQGTFIFALSWSVYITLFAGIGSAASHSSHGLVGLSSAGYFILWIAPLTLTLMSHLLSSDLAAWLERLSPRIWRQGAWAPDQDAGKNPPKDNSTDTPSSNEEAAMPERDIPLIGFFFQTLCRMAVLTIFLLGTINCASQLLFPNNTQKDSISILTKESSSNSADNPISPQSISKQSNLNMQDSSIAGNRTDETTSSLLTARNEPAAATLSSSQIAERARMSSVLLAGKTSKGLTIGSGFFVRSGLIATNYHVIVSCSELIAKSTASGKVYQNLKVLHIDKKNDLAILAVNETSLPPIPLGDDTALNLGDTVYAYGNPEGLEGTFSSGNFSTVRTYNQRRLLQISAPISPGSSGGPILNNKGEVVGVAVLVHTEAQNLNFAVPVTELKYLLNRGQSSLSESVSSRKVEEAGLTTVDNSSGLTNEQRRKVAFVSYIFLYRRGYVMTTVLLSKFVQGQEEGYSEYTLKARFKNELDADINEGISACRAEIRKLVGNNRTSDLEEWCTAGYRDGTLQALTDQKTNMSIPEVFSSMLKQRMREAASDRSRKLQLDESEAIQLSDGFAEEE